MYVCSSKDNKKQQNLITELNRSGSCVSGCSSFILNHPVAESCSGSNGTLRPGDLLCSAATLELGQPVKTSTCWLLGSRTFPSSFWPHPHPLCAGGLVPTLPFCSRHHCSPTLPPQKGQWAMTSPSRSSGSVRTLSQSPPFRNAQKFHHELTSTCPGHQQRHHPPPRSASGATLRRRGATQVGRISNQMRSFW